MPLGFGRYSNPSALKASPICSTRARPIDFDLSIQYTKNSLVIDSEEMKTIQACAAENSIVVCLGFSELSNACLYVGQCTI